MVNTSQSQVKKAHFLAIALKELKQGREVFPCKGKVPAIMGGKGCQDATVDENIIYEFAKQFPSANAGVTFRHSSKEIGIDVDQDVLAKFQALVKEHGQFNTRTVLTGRGGYHFYFLRPQGVTLRNIAKTEGLGFELKSNNQYLLAPGSIHPDTGKVYELVSDMPPQPIPDWLIALAVNKPLNKRQQRKPITRLQNGSRHSSLIVYIGRQRALGHTESEIQKLALALNHDSDDPLPEDEVIKMVRQYESQSKVSKDGSPLDDTLHDVGNARRLISQFGDRLRYNYERSLWLIYNGKHWEWDEGSRINQLAKVTVKNIYHEAGDTTDEDKQDKLAKHAKASQSNVRIKAMIEQARDEVAIKVLDLNADQYLLNVNNGTVNLKTGELQLHNPDDLITQFIPIDYIPGTKGNKFDNFLKRIFENNQVLITYIQKSLGYSITGNQQEQALWFNKGAGWNGKTTLFGIVGDVLNDYAGEIDPMAFMVDKNAHTGPNEALASLYGKRFVTSVEIKTGMKLNVALVKRMTGGEKIRCERKFEHGFEFQPTHKLWLLGNAEPRIDDNTNSIWFRIKYIPFNVTIPPEERDKTLRPSILKDEGAAVLAWLVEGCLLWQKEGLGEPEIVREAISAYRESQDILHDYFFENCLDGINETVSIADAYNSYLEWANENKYEPLGKTGFGNRLKEKGYYTKSGHGNKMFWHGFRLKTPEEKVILVNLVNQNSESSQEISSQIETSEKTVNQLNQLNPACESTGVNLAAYLGMPLDKVIAIWEKEGKPAIRLSQAVTCSDLEKLIHNPGIDKEKLKAIRMWLVEHE